MGTMYCLCCLDPELKAFPQPYATALFSFLYHLASYENGKSFCLVTDRADWCLHCPVNKETGWQIWHRKHMKSKTSKLFTCFIIHCLPVLVYIVYLLSNILCIIVYLFCIYRIYSVYLFFHALFTCFIWETNLCLWGVFKKSKRIEQNFTHL